METRSESHLSAAPCSDLFCFVEMPPSSLRRRNTQQPDQEGYPTIGSNLECCLAAWLPGCQRSSIWHVCFSWSATFGWVNEDPEIAPDTFPTR